VWVEPLDHQCVERYSEVEKHEGVITDLCHPFGGFASDTLPCLGSREANRKENEYKSLVALPWLVGRPVPVRWALVVVGWVVRVVCGFVVFPYTRLKWKQRVGGKPNDKTRIVCSHIWGNQWLHLIGEHAFVLFFSKQRGLPGKSGKSFVLINRATSGSSTQMKWMAHRHRPPLALLELGRTALAPSFQPRTNIPWLKSQHGTDVHK
jgi:hypothetical protein